MTFVLVTARREGSEISAVVEAEEWDRLRALAEALPSNMTWTAKAHSGAGHRSESTVARGSDSPQAKK